MGKIKIEDATVLGETKVINKKQSDQIDMSFNNSEAEFEPVPTADVSPLAEEVNVRKGGDDFLKQNQKFFEGSFNNSGDGQGRPSANTSQNELPFDRPTNSFGDAKEFKVVDPEMEMMMAQESQQMEVDKKIVEQSSDLLSDVIIDVFAMVIPDAAESYYRINESKIKEFEKQDKLPEGTVDHVKAINKEQKGMVKLDKDHKEMLRKPLQQVMQAKGIKAKPETVLIIVVIAVFAMLFLKVRSIRKDNDERIMSWMEGYADAKERAKRKSDQMLKSNKNEEVIIPEEA